MRIALFIILVLFIFSCNTEKPPPVIYKTGDRWVSNFVNDNYTSKAYADDKIYCSSLLIGHDSSNRFYCLNLKTGKVDWAVPVKNWASHPPIICDSFIYYCSYVGDIYKFDKHGRQLWYLAFPSTYGGHILHPGNKNLIVGTVVSGLREIDCQTGQVIDTIGHNQRNVPFPVFRHDTVYQAIDGILSCTTAAGHPAWKKETGEKFDNLFENSGKLYYLSDSKYLYCLNAKTAERIWKSDFSFLQPLHPYLSFKGETIIGDFTDSNELFLINSRDGKIEKTASYEELQKLNYVTPVHKEYKISQDSKNYYLIGISNTHPGAKDFRDAFDVRIDKKQYR